MISDEERREVAKRMREYDVAEFRESAIVPFLECLGHGYMSCRGILDELADLIDPTCHVTSRPGDDENDVCDSCSVCDFGWHKSRFDPPYRHCPNCGAKVIERGGCDVREL